MSRHWVVLLSLAVIRTVIAQQIPDFGRSASSVDEELQRGIEAKLPANLEGWEFGRAQRSGPRVSFRGTRAAESLDISTHYMTSAVDAAKRLRSYKYMISVGVGTAMQGVGQEAFSMVYGSQVILIQAGLRRCRGSRRSRRSFRTFWRRTLEAARTGGSRSRHDH